MQPGQLPHLPPGTRWGRSRSRFLGVVLCSLPAAQLWGLQHTQATKAATTRHKKGQNVLTHGDGGTAAAPALPGCGRSSRIHFFGEKKGILGTVSPTSPGLHGHCCGGHARAALDTRLGNEAPSCPKIRTGWAGEPLPAPPSPSPCTPGAEENKMQETPHLANDKTIVFHSWKWCDATGTDCIFPRNTWIQPPHPPHPSGNARVSSGCFSHLKASALCKSCSLSLFFFK